MDKYLLMKKELRLLANSEAKKIASELISKHANKTVSELQKATLECIHKNQLPDEISFVLKEKIALYISAMKIPTQKDE